jgi:hypothetical protein
MSSSLNFLNGQSLNDRYQLIIQWFSFDILNKNLPKEVQSTLNNDYLILNTGFDSSD